MCGRFHILSPIAAMADLFGFDERPNMTPAHNIAPTMPVPIVRSRPDSTGRQLHFARWGFIPSWSKDPMRNPPLINARVETVWEKPSFRHAIARRRCIMPADGFWEWQRAIDGNHNKKQAYRIHRSDNAPMAFAAIWEHWMGPDGSEIESVAMLTCPPNALVGAIHHRMPVILEPDQFADWFHHDESRTHKRRVDAMMVPCDPDRLTLYAVDNRVGNIQHDDPDLLTPINVGQTPIQAGTTTSPSNRQGSLF